MPETPSERYMLILSDLPDEVVEHIRAIADGFCVQRLRRDDPVFPELLPRAEVIIGWIGAEDIARATSLRWVQLGSAGANRIIDQLPEHVRLTNASGVFGVPMAEHVMAMMLALTRCLPEAIRAAGERRWSQPVQREELAGTTCGVIGLGDIGTEVARRAKAFGMRVLAVKRRPIECPPFVDELWGLTGLDRLIAQSHHIVNTLPGTVHTRKIVAACRFLLMKKGARFYNVGRGTTVDEAALIEALRSGHLAGAGLDVFENEPLPADSPLWHMPNVIITPHRSAQSSRYMERFTPIVLRNVVHYLRGEPLVNLVDRHWGY